MLHLTAPWRFAVALAATLLAFLVQLGGRGPGLVSVVLSALADFFFIAPAWGWATPWPALTMLPHELRNPPRAPRAPLR